MTRNNVKNPNRLLRRKYNHKFLNDTTKSATYVLKTALKRVIKKLQKQRMIWLEIKLLIKLEKSQKSCHRIIQRQFQMKQKITQFNIFFLPDDPEIVKL